MKTSGFTEEQMAFAIKQHVLGTRTEEICLDLTERDKEVNRTKSQTRAKIEQPFLTHKRICGFACSVLP